MGWQSWTVPKTEFESVYNLGLGRVSGIEPQRWAGMGGISRLLRVRCRVGCGRRGAVHEVGAAVALQGGRHRRIHAGRCTLHSMGPWDHDRMLEERYGAEQTELSAAFNQQNEIRAVRRGPAESCQNVDVSWLKRRHLLGAVNMRVRARARTYIVQ